MKFFCKFAKWNDFCPSKKNIFMKRLGSVLLVIAGYFWGLAVLNAQVEGEAKSILDKLSAKTKSYTSMDVNFTFTMDGNGISEIRKGRLRMKGDAYRMELDSLVILCDGKKIITIRRELCEGQSIPADEIDEDALTPQSMFTLYERGFKGKVKERKNKDGKRIVTIDLFPLNPKEKDYSIVRLDIDEDKLQITQALVIGKNGARYTYKIEKFMTDSPINSGLFIFEASQFPCVKIVE
jgi:outer membrane lipoprotein-sorting protein